jgi:hypothetical protein
MNRILEVTDEDETLVLEYVNCGFRSKWGTDSI